MKDFKEVDRRTATNSDIFYNEIHAELTLQNQDKTIYIHAMCIPEYDEGIEYIVSEESLYDLYFPNTEDEDFDELDNMDDIDRVRDEGIQILCFDDAGEYLEYCKTLSDEIKEIAINEEIVDEDYEWEE